MARRGREEVNGVMRLPLRSRAAATVDSGTTVIKCFTALMLNFSRELATERAELYNATV